MPTSLDFSFARWSDGVTVHVPASQHVAVVPDGATAHIVLNRPDRRNALDASMWKAVGEAALGLAADAAVKVVTLRGAGAQAFSAGADIHEFESVYRTPESASAHNAVIRAAQDALAALPQPTIAMIRGACVGGGCGLALACDLRFVATDGRLAITPARIGAAYGVVETRRLVAAVGASRAKDLLFSARAVDGAEALRIGLADHMAAPDELDAVVRDYAAVLLKNSSQSITLMKSMVNDCAKPDPAVSAAIEEAYVKSFHSAHFSEGYSAFIAKRPANFR